MTGRVFAYEPQDWPQRIQLGEQPLQLAEHQVKRVDFRAIFPEDGAWKVDNTVATGTFEVRNREWYASAETIIRFAKMAEHLMPTEPKTVRGEVLDQAKSLVDGDRNAQYGEPYDDFLKVADALNAYGYSGPGGRKIMPRDIPFFQVLVKLSRIVESPTKMDSWIDMAGYAACGAEVAYVEDTVAVQDAE